MITGFHLKQIDGFDWWEKHKWLRSYYWVFRDTEYPHGVGVCLTITYTPR
jgi:hypothetical protein